MIVSHNTFTYRKPVKWWMWLLMPFARCQSHTISQQVERGGVDCADIRIRLYNNEWYVCHGPVIFDLPYWKALFECASNKVYNVRLLLEGHYTFEDTKTLAFPPAFNFYEYRDKRTWKTIPTVYKREFIKDLQQHVGSMQSWYGKICPWLWHVLHGRKLTQVVVWEKQQYSHSFDFI